MDEATLIRDARTHAGLSLRALARLSGVAASTISRIEAGSMSPTASMLRTILAATGRELTLSAPLAAGSLPAQKSRQLPAPRHELRDLTGAWRRTEDGDEPDFTPLRGFLDYIALHPEHAPAAVAKAPDRSGSAMQDALLAAIAEKIADDAGFARPAWTSKIGPLPTPWQSPGMHRTRELARETAPGQLAERGLLIGRASLWRERTPVAR